MTQGYEHEIMKTIDEQLKSTKSDKHYPEVSSKKTGEPSEDSLMSFWDNEYDEAWNDC